MMLRYPAALAACTLLAAPTFACMIPTVPQIPGEEGLELVADIEQTQAVLERYFIGLQSYTQCVLAELEAAGGDDATEPMRSLLIQRNNAAVAEAQAIQTVWNERMAAVAPEDSPEDPR